MGYVTFDELGRGYWAEAMQRSTGPGRRQVNQARPYTLRVTPGSYENSRWRGSLINRPALDVVEQNRPAHRPALDIVDPDRPAGVAYVWADAFYKDPDSVVRFTCRVGRHKARTITPEELEERAREALESGYSHLHL